jgi:hypothetical protein
MVGGWVGGRHPSRDRLGMGMVKREGLARDTSEYLVDEAVASASTGSWLVCSELLNIGGIVPALCTRLLT